MVALTLMVTVAMVALVINWTRLRVSPMKAGQAGGRLEEATGSQLSYKYLTARHEPVGGQYLANQQHHSRRHHQRLASAKGSRRQSDKVDSSAL